jgi:malonyl CoA-acyl carrier protein transacylase
VVLVAIGGAVLSALLETFGMRAVGVDPTVAIGFSAGTVSVSVVAALVAVPTFVAQLIGLVATYAEQRGYEAPVNSAQLAGELDRP